MVLEARVDHQDSTPVNGYESSVQHLGNGEMLILPATGTQLGIEIVNAIERINAIEDPTEKTRFLHRSVDASARASLQFGQMDELTPEQEVRLARQRGFIQGAFLNATDSASLKGHQNGHQA